MINQQASRSRKIRQCFAEQARSEMHIAQGMNSAWSHGCVHICAVHVPCDASVGASALRWSRSCCSCAMLADMAGESAAAAWCRMTNLQWRSTPRRRFPSNCPTAKTYPTTRASSALRCSRLRPGWACLLGSTCSSTARCAGAPHCVAHPCLQ